MKLNKAKKLKFVEKTSARQWVGDGFYVHPLLRPSKKLNEFISPFLLIDYAPPRLFSKTNQRRGVGEHPHRGFETVTFAYQGEVEHRDSSGGGGIIKPGDVQWMTAGQGLVHDEFHSDSFSQTGGVFEMVQLWVNLPKKYKMVSPRYQGIESQNIPKVQLNKEVQLRVVAGNYEKKQGPAMTFSPINMYEVVAQNFEEILLPLKDNTNTLMLIREGEGEIEGKSYGAATLLIFDSKGESLSFKVSKNFKALILNGEPLNEPVVAHGPFVMNTSEEILQALQDYQEGRMGNLK